MAKTTVKGFFFVLATLITLGYIVASVTLWTKSMEVAEGAYAEKFKMSNVEVVISQISKENVQKFADIVAYHSLYKVNTLASGGNTLKYDETAADPYSHIRHAFNTMITNGTVDPNDFDDGDALQTGEPDSLSMAAWFSKINSTVSSVGLEVTDYSLSEFNLNQTNYDELNYSFVLNFSIRDKSNRVYIDRSYYINGTLFITGINDPAVYRETAAKIPSPVNKPMFFYISPVPTSSGIGYYISPEEVKPNQIPFSMASGQKSGGQGWFYGQLVYVKDASSKSLSLVELNSTILVGTFSEITGLIAVLPGELDWKDFGAYIVTNEPVFPGDCGPVKTEDQTLNPISCDPSTNQPEIRLTSLARTEKPFAVIPGFKIEYMPEYGYYDASNVAISSSRILFVNKYSPSEVLGTDGATKKFNSKPVLYNLEKLRDMAVCGYYVPNKDAPSYLQRLVKNSYSLKDEKFGIESFAFGTWINSTTTIYTDELSRLDRELFNENTGVKIRGMPGCKTPLMCDQESPIGHFRLEDSFDAYVGLGDMVNK